MTARPQSPMVTAKEAVKISSAFVADLYPDSRDHRLEQVAPYGTEWEVVLSFRVPDEQSGLVTQLSGPRREFKAIEVDRDSGESLALKFWKM